MSDILHVTDILATRVVYYNTTAQSSSSEFTKTPAAGKLLLIARGSDGQWSSPDTTITYDNVTFKNIPYLVSADGKRTLAQLCEDYSLNPHFVAAKLQSQVNETRGKLVELSNEKPSEIGTTLDSGDTTDVVAARADHVHTIGQSTIESVLTNQNISEFHVRKISSGKTLPSTGATGDIFILIGE